MATEDWCSAPPRAAPGPEAAYPASQLFAVRLWLEELGNGAVAWRGSVQHVTSGRQRYFREWPALVAAVQEMLAACEGGTVEDWQSFEDCQSCWGESPEEREERSCCHERAGQCADGAKGPPVHSQP
jgi:hypothetical protein